MPRIATKPSGFWKMSSAAIIPIRPIGRHARGGVSLNGQSRYALATPDQRMFLAKLESRKLTERNGSSIFKWNSQRLQGRERSALFVGRRPVTYFPIS